MTSRTCWTRAISASVPLKISALPWGSTVMRSDMLESEAEESPMLGCPEFGFWVSRCCPELVPPASPMARWRATGAARWASSKRM